VIRYVIDASALVKLVVPEDGSDTMQTLATLHRAGTIQLLTPDFALTECANVLGRYARRTETPHEDMQEAFHILCQLGLAEISQRPLVEEALLLAMRHDRAVYDVLYLVLAPYATAGLPAVLDGIHGQTSCPWHTQQRRP
jgi:predicted nucleic acid-binding protein